MASNLQVMASNLQVIASNLLAMASSFFPSGMSGPLTSHRLPRHGLSGVCRDASGVDTNAFGRTMVDTNTCWRRWEEQIGTSFVASVSNFQPVPSTPSRILLFFGSLRRGFKWILWLECFFDRTTRAATT